MYRFYILHLFRKCGRILLSIHLLIHCSVRLNLPELTLDIVTHVHCVEEELSEGVDPLVIHGLDTVFDRVSEFTDIVWKSEHVGETGSEGEGEAGLDIFREFST